MQAPYSVSEVKALRDERDRAYEIIGELTQKLDGALIALKKIAEGRGRFSTDQLTFASNTIDDMKELALAAIAETETAATRGPALRSSLNTTEQS